MKKKKAFVYCCLAAMTAGLVCRADIINASGAEPLVAEPVPEESSGMFCPEKGTDYFTEGILAGAGEPWADEGGVVRVRAAPGRELKPADDENAPWTEELVYSEPCPAEDVTFYVRRESTEEESEEKKDEDAGGANEENGENQQSGENSSEGENEQGRSSRPEGDNEHGEETKKWQSGIASVRFGIEDEKMHASSSAAGIRLAEPADKQDEAGNPLYQDKAVPVHMTAEDSCSGIRRILWTVSGEKSYSTIFPAQPSGVISAGDHIDGWTVTSARGGTVTSCERTVYIQEEKNAVTVRMGFDDWAGHHTGGGQVCFSADRTPPQVIVGEAENSGDPGGRDKEPEDSTKEPENSAKEPEGSAKEPDKPEEVTVVVTDNNVENGEGSAVISDESGEEAPGGNEWQRIDHINGYETTVELPGGGDRWTVRASDRAGNITEKTIGAPVKKEDREIDEITVKGVKEGEVYRDLLTSDITMADSAFAGGDVKLYRMREDGSEEEVSGLYLRDVDGDDKGKRMRISNPGSDPVEDGIYRMEIRARDRAGNERTENVRFSVNHSGSRFIYSEDLNRLRGTYQKKISRPVTVTEYSPAPLDPDATKIEILRNGIPLEKVSFRRLDRKAGEEGWYRSVYILEAGNFSGDGLYQINLISADKEGNHAQSAIANGQAAFTVDSVCPVISGVRLIRENGGCRLQYSVFDESGIKRIRVTGGGRVLGSESEPEGKIRVNESADIPESLSSGPVCIEAEDLAGNRAAFVWPQVKAASGTGHVPAAVQETGKGDEKGNAARWILPGLVLCFFAVSEVRRRHGKHAGKQRRTDRHLP